MGNRLFKKQEASSSTDQTVAAEQKLAKEPMTTQPEDSGAMLNQEVAESGKPDIVESENVTPALPKEECVACAEPLAAALQSEAENLAKEAPAPVLGVSVPSPPEPAAVHQLAAESKPKPNVEAMPVPISESAPAEPAPQAMNLTEESVHDPTPSSLPSVEPAIPDLSSQPDKAPAAPADIPAPAASADIPAPVIPEVPSDVPAEECSAEGVVIPTSVPEKAAETSESLKPTEGEATGNSEKLMSDVNMKSISGQLKQLELSGSDLVADLIPSDIKMSADTTVADTNGSTELM
ncbi:predicted GPI-anchored protein 58 [Thalassophryne amazonica]|uniref:predicted GPI-anchored protein 58 n=1 Tax=Thalassophryne amazonica TaxID=390379 RepID=UPI001471663E|nr:predicted GPI-anchored protein 58 [Thalassophryne amazonica]